VGTAGQAEGTTKSWRTPVILFTLTFAATTFVGFLQSGDGRVVTGLRYSVPLMTILLSHELGHYIAAKIHRVPASPPYFIPLPLPPLGTMGAVILMPDRIRSRNALLDIGAAGPLAGMVVALPVLVFGILESPVEALPSDQGYLQEGHSLLYAGLLYLLKGPIPPGHDIMLSPTAFAGWAGLLVTMLNLIPAVQLDGGHVGHALFGDRHERISRTVRALLLPVALLTALAYGWPAWRAGMRGDPLTSQVTPAFAWVIWWLLLRFLARRAHREHPPTDGEPLTRRRRLVGWLCLGLFILLFMPAWLRYVPAEPAMQGISG
jgi:membrane-associated protease RseP (regulator of RpoE activity)